MQSGPSTGLGPICHLPKDHHDCAGPYSPRRRQTGAPSHRHGVCQPRELNSYGLGTPRAAAQGGSGTGAAHTCPTRTRTRRRPRRPDGAVLRRRPRRDRGPEGCAPSGTARAVGVPRGLRPARGARPCPVRRTRPPGRTTHPTVPLQGPQGTRGPCHAGCRRGHSDHRRRRQGQGRRPPCRAAPRTVARRGARDRLTRLAEARPASRQRSSIALASKVPRTQRGPHGCRGALSVV